MRYLKYLALLAFLAVPAIYAPAQVSVGVGVQIGPDYGYYNPPPVCEFGYYPYYPFACAPYGYWGPSYFVDGIFIGAGPWYRFYYVHPELYERWGYHRWHDRDDWRGREAFRGNFRDGDRFRGDRNFRGGEAFRGGNGFRGGENFHSDNRFRGGENFHGNGNGGFRGGQNFRGGNGGREFHGGGNGNHGGDHGGHGEHGGRR